MLKQAKELNIDIVSIEDYVELMGKPNDNFGEADQELLYRLIRQATTQFDSLVSGVGNVGYLFKWWNELQDNDEDNSKGYRLQKAICSWVETMVQNGKFWTDGVPNLSSNIDYDIKSSSKNSNIELKRKDIIQDLVAIGLTTTTNLTKPKNANGDCNNVDDYLLTTKQYLNDNYVSLNSMGENQILKSGLNMGENPITNGGDIWNTNPNKKKLINYELQGCKVDLQQNQILSDDLEVGKVLSEAQGQTIFFNNEQDYNQFKESNNIDDSYFENVQIQNPNEVDVTNLAKLDASNQFIYGQTFEKGITFDIQKGDTTTKPIFRILNKYDDVINKTFNFKQLIYNNNLNYLVLERQTKTIEQIPVGDGADAIATKGYVDDLPKRQNQFKGIQSFESISFTTPQGQAINSLNTNNSGLIEVSNNLEILKRDGNNNAIATKEYVDDKTQDKVLEQYNHNEAIVVGEYIDENFQKRRVLRKFIKVTTNKSIEKITILGKVKFIMNYCIFSNIKYATHQWVDGNEYPLPYYWNGSSDFITLEKQATGEVQIVRQWIDSTPGVKYLRGFVDYVEYYE